MKALFLDPIFFTPPSGKGLPRRLHKGGGGYEPSREERDLLSTQNRILLAQLGRIEPRMDAAFDRYDRAVSEVMDPAYEAQRVGQANADAQQAIASNTAAMGRNLQRYGLNPNSGRFAAVQAQNATGNAALQAGAANSARNAAQQVRLGAADNYLQRMLGMQGNSMAGMQGLTGQYQNIGMANFNARQNDMNGWGQAIGTGLGMWGDAGFPMPFAKGGKVNANAVRLASGGRPRRIVSPQMGQMAPRIGQIAGRAFTRLADAGNVSGAGMAAGNAGVGANTPLAGAMAQEAGMHGAGALSTGTAEAMSLGGAEQLSTLGAQDAALGVAGEGAIGASTAEALAGGAAAEGAVSGALATAGAALPWVGAAVGLGSALGFFRSGGKVRYDKNSIVDHLKAAGQDASFKSRAELFRKHFGGRYRGTASQNTRLLALLRQPKPAIEGTATRIPDEPQPAPNDVRAELEDAGREVAAMQDRRVALADAHALAAQELSEPLPDMQFAKGGAVDIDALLSETADRHGVDEALLSRMIGVESGYRANARSRAGAAGLGQLMPGTAKMLGVKNVNDPRENLDASARYLKQLMTQFGGSPELAVAAYNMGPTALRKRGVEGLPRETRHHLVKVFGQDGVERAKAAWQTVGSQPTRLADTRRRRAKPQPLPDLPNIGADMERMRPENQRAIAHQAHSQAPSQAAPREYAIRRGDTLSDIATRAGTTVDDLMAKNPQIRDANRIYAGARLALADGGKADNLESVMKRQGMGGSPKERKLAYEALFKEPYQGKPEQDAKLMEVLNRVEKQDEGWDQIMTDATPRVRMAKGGACRKNMAAGGEVDGPGTETSDSIPALLSDGEYVLNAEAVKLVGEKALDTVNNAGLMLRHAKQGEVRMASGGGVGSAIASGLNAYLRTRGDLEDRRFRREDRAQQAIDRDMRRKAEQMRIDEAQRQIDLRTATGNAFAQANPENASGVYDNAGRPMTGEADTLLAEQQQDFTPDDLRAVGIRTPGDGERAAANTALRAGDVTLGATWQNRADALDKQAKAELDERIKKQKLEHIAKTRNQWDGKMDSLLKLSTQSGLDPAEIAGKTYDLRKTESEILENTAQAGKAKADAAKARAEAADVGTTGGVKLTPAQQANNLEIDRARRFMKGVDKDLIMLYVTPSDQYGEKNPRYRPDIAMAWRKSQERKIGQDDDFDAFSAAQLPVNKRSSLPKGSVPYTKDGKQVTKGGKPVYMTPDGRYFVPE